MYEFIQSRTDVTLHKRQDIYDTMRHLCLPDIDSWGKWQHSQCPNWQFLFIINFEWEKVFCLFKWFNYQLARSCHQMMTWWSEVLLNIQVTHTFYPHLSLTWVPLTWVSAPLRVSSTEHGASDHVLGVHWGAHTLCVTQHTHIHSLQIFEAIEHCMCLLLLLTWRTSEVGPLE